MAISKLSAGSQGTGTNSTGAQLVSSVNSIIDKIETTGMTVENMNIKYLYRDYVSSGTLDAAFEDGTYTVSGPTEGPTELSSASGKIENSIMRITLHGNNWQLQEVFPMARPNEVYYRINRPLRTSGAVFNEWTRPQAGGQLYKKKVVFLGDSITASHNMTMYFQQLTGCEVVNGAVGGSRAGEHTTEHYDELSGHKMAEAISSGDWTSVINAGAALHVIDGTKSLDTRTVALSELDWGYNTDPNVLEANEVDYLVIGYGTNDFGGNNNLGVDTDVDNVNFYAAYRNMVRDIIDQYPHLRILWWLPIWRGYVSVDVENDNSPIFVAGGSNNSDFVNPKGHTLKDYSDVMKEILEDHNQSYIDLHQTSGITERTHDHFLDAIDQLHPSEAGAKRIAEKLIAAIRTHF